MNIIRNTKGIALGTVLILASILTLLGFTIWHYSSRDILGAERAEKKMQAYYLAKSGADAVAQYIITNPDNIDMSAYVESLIDAPESNPIKLDEDTPGHFNVKVDRDKDNSLVITATGTVDSIKESVQIKLHQRENIPEIDVALFANSNINMGQSGSSKIIGDVATNAEQPGSIYFPWSAYIKGNLFIGPNGNIDKVITGARPNPKDNVEGEIHKLEAIRNYELPDFPDFPSNLPNRGAFEAGWNPSPPYHIYHDGRYSKITVLSELVVHIGDQDRIIVTDDLIVEGAGKITLNKTGKGKLYLYVGNEFKILNSGTINNRGQASDVILYFKGSGTINLGGNTKFVGCVHLENANLIIANSGGITGHIITGGNHIEISGAASAHVRAIYAPNAHVKMKGSGSLTGALICKSFEAEGNSTLTFDNSITDTFPDMLEEGASGGVSYEKGLWQ